MRRLFCSLLAATALAVPASAWQSPSSVFLTPQLTTRSRGPRGIGASFWLDEDTGVVPHVERSRDAATAAAIPDEAIVRLRPGASIAAFAMRHGLTVQRALSLPGV